MFRFGETLMLSMWILRVCSTPRGYNTPLHESRKNRLDLSVNEINFVENDEDTKFYKNMKYRWKSEEKCDEYAQAVEQTMWILPLSAPRPLPIANECKPLINPLISGGEIAESGEFPHMAAIGWLLENGTIGYYCGGSLISERWILTAAHCTHGSLGQPVAALLGSVRLSDKKSGRLIRIASIRRHPAYKPPSMYADIALLKLTRKVSFDRHVKPACLHSQFDKAPSRAWVTGWGSTEIAGDLSDVLIKARLEVIDNLHCALLHNVTRSAPRGIVPSMLCAGDPNGGWRKDTCPGDSGGPLQSLHRNNCLYEIVGITSFGKLCASPDFPGVYTRVSHYAEWIESTVWPDDV